MLHCIHCIAIYVLTQHLLRYKMTKFIDRYWENMFSKWSQSWVGDELDNGFLWYFIICILLYQRLNLQFSGHKTPSQKYVISKLCLWWRMCLWSDSCLWCRDCQWCSRCLWSNCCHWYLELPLVARTLLQWCQVYECFLRWCPPSRCHRWFLSLQKQKQEYFLLSVFAFDALNFSIWTWKDKECRIRGHRPY